MKNLKSLFILFIFPLFTSCSFLLNYTVAPGAATEQPNVYVQGNTVYVSFSSFTNAQETTNETTGSWKQKYAYYIYRSEDDPYSGYQLIGRLYSPSSATLFSGINLLGHNEQYDFSLSNNYDNGIQTIAKTSNTPVFYDTTAPHGKKLYYRTVLINLKCDITLDDNNYIFSQVYKLETDTPTAWIGVEL